MTRRLAGFGSRGPFLWVLLAIAATVMWGSWAIASPAGSSPDDDFHLSSIWCAGGPAAHARPSEECTKADGFQGNGTINRVVPIGVMSADCIRFPSAKTCWHYKGLKPCPIDPAHPSAECVPDRNRGLGAHAANDGLYPPVFYATMHTMASSHPTASVLLMRTANALLALLMMSLAFAVSDRRTRGAFALTAFFGFCAPFGLFFVPSTNPTAWSVIGIGTLWVFLTTFLTTESRPRRWIAGAASVVAAALPIGARADAPVLVALTLGAVTVLVFVQTRRLGWKLLLPGTLIALAGAAFLAGSGGSVAANGLTPAAAGDGRGPDPIAAQQIADNAAHPVHLFLSNLSRILDYERQVFFNGRLGWGDIVTDPRGTLIPAFVLCIVIAGAIAYRGWARATYVLLCVASLAIPLMVMQESHVSERTGYVQPRYMFPLMLAVLGLAGLAFLSSTAYLRLPKWAVPVVWAITTLFSSMTLHRVVDHYALAKPQPGVTPDTHHQLWWLNIGISPVAVWAIGTIATAGTLALLLRIVVESRTTIDARESSTA